MYDFTLAPSPRRVRIFLAEKGIELELVQVDIMRNATITVPDKVKEFQYKASGGKIAALFDGSERMLSIDCLSWYNRAIYTP